MIYLLLCNLHDCTFKVVNYSRKKIHLRCLSLGPKCASAGGLGPKCASAGRYNIVVKIQMEVSP